jgi:hypothetical protein
MVRLKVKILIIRFMLTLTKKKISLIIDRAYPAHDDDLCRYHGR